MTQPKLPLQNELGYYEIRMESIGGMGANLAGLILTEACVLQMGYNGLNFSSYGSEKKGTPVKAFVRLGSGDMEMRDNSPVERPHMLAIFAEQLLGTVPMTQGFRKGGVVVVNTKKDPKEIMDVMKLPGCRVVCVDALKIAMEEKIPLNTAMLGAISKASGFIDPDAVKKVIEGKIGKKYPHLVEGNMRAFDRGYKEVREIDYCTLEDHPEVPFQRVEPDLGYETEPFGGVITNPGNTILKNHAASRVGYIPVWHEEKCIHCGDCDLACPDYCMVFEFAQDEKGKRNAFMRGVDYTYCKGCLRCVEICPVEALTKEKESDYNVDEIRADLRRVL